MTPDVQDERPHPDETRSQQPRARPTRGSRRLRRLLKDLHQRTWELEMLISGAIAFALWQVPGEVDTTYARIAPTLAGGASVLAYFVYYYLKLILYTLIASFLGHLVVRAFWVALVGLDSVFPRGVRWTELRQGPNTSRVYRARLPSIRELIVHSDALASVIFAATFSLVGVFVISVIAGGVLGPLGIVFNALLPFPVGAPTVALVAALAVASWISLPPLIDRHFGARLDPDGRLARGLRTVIGLNARLAGLAFYGPIQFTLASHLGARRVSAGIAVAIVGLVAFFVVNDLVVRQGRIDFRSSPWLVTEAGRLGVDPRYYEAYRGAVFDLPSLPSEVVEDDRPFLRLFVPYVPVRDDEVIARLCPDAAAPAPGLTLRGDLAAPPDSVLPRLEATLTCVAAAWAVTLDGDPIRAAPVFMRHPETGIRGLAYYLDIRGIEPGQHVLAVERTEGARDSDTNQRPLRHEILFWR